jgi:hypothetical protein
MKKIIWLVFALLAALWTGLAVIALKLVSWMLATVAAVRIPDSAAGMGASPLPDGLLQWVDPGILHALQGAFLSVIQGLNKILPSVGGLDGWISALVWIAWGLIMAALLVLALVLHWLAGRRPAAASLPALQADGNRARM